MNLTIISPEKQVFCGEVTSVSVPGKKGRFTILQNHAAIISTLNKGEIVYKNGEAENTIEINSGLVEMNNNNITICIE